MLCLRRPARQGPQRRLQHCQRRGGASPSVAGIPFLQGGEDVKLYSHFVHLERYGQAHFDYAVVLTGSGAPRGLTVPFRSTRLINRRLKDGWRLDKTLRLGRTGKRLWLEVMLIKERPVAYRWKRPRIVGMDSNYRAGFVFSDGQHVGAEIYARIQTFAKRQKHTFKEVSDLVGKALRQVDWSRIDVLVLEKLAARQDGKARDVLSPIQQAPVALALPGL